MGPTLNLAEQSAEEAMVTIQRCIDGSESFILEAGAGAGKTYSLIKALEYVINKNGRDLIKNNRRIACITYTEVAKEQIDKRTDKHPAIHSSTIHSFCWSIIKNFQNDIREELPHIGKWGERIIEKSPDGLGSREVIYELGYPSINEKYITLYHDDVLDLMIVLLKKPRFRSIFISSYPVVFIDEYQDTYSKLYEAINEHFLGNEKSPLIGFFGDHWQKIYGNGCGQISHPSLKVINKNSNFRSTKEIVDVLNHMRTELTQNIKDPEEVGSATVFHTNEWSGVRRTEPHWKGDLPSDIAREHLNALMTKLKAEGWDFSPDKSKILMLTHNVLAEEQGYQNFANVFDRNELFVKKEDDYVAFMVDVLEPFFDAYKNKKSGEMFSIIGGKRPTILSPADKSNWSICLNTLMDMRKSATIGEIIKYIRDHKKPQLPQKLEEREIELENFVVGGEIEEPKWMTRARSLKDIKYEELIAFARFSNEHTPFATKHGVKGAEFENVLVVVGRGWSQYNFDQMISWTASGVPSDKKETYERSRNLMYVVCSRPKKRLALLFTQLLSQESISILTQWFGNNIQPLNV